MINDHRPYFIKSCYRWIENSYARRFVAPQLAALGSGYHFMKPWNIRIYGASITIGDNAHIVTAADRNVCLSTWNHKEYQGHIVIGDHCLLCPGVRIDSASEVRIGNSCMIAAGAYLTDADWHDIYDRTKVIGKTLPVRLEDNVWIGDGATICKGVTIGENSIIGASAVVTADVPANSIAAGNPARVVRDLDRNEKIISRAHLFADPAGYAEFLEAIDRYLLKENTLRHWLRTLILPRRGD